MAMSPAVDCLHRHKLPRAVAIILIYLLLLTVLIVFIYLIVPQIIQQTSTMLPQLEQYYLSFKSGLAGSPYTLLREIAWQLPASLRSLPVSEAPAGQAVTLEALGQTLSTAGALISGLFTLIAILLIGFYWTLEGERALRSLLLPLSSAQRESVREIIGQVTARVGGYIRGQALLALTIFLVSLAAYLLSGLPSALALALLAGILELIPVLGPALAASPAVLVALAAAPDKVLWVIALSAFIQFLANNVLAPRIIHKTVGVNPVVTLLAIVAFGALFGFAGIVLAIPVAAVVQILLDRAVLHPTASVMEEPAGRDRLSKLRYDTQELAVDVRKLIRRRETVSDPAQPDDLEDTIEALALDLDSIVAQATTPESTPQGES
jgi:predicted PurR-regulated permease PerM